MLSKRNEKQIMHIVLFIILLFVGAGSFIRIFFGAELSDEAYSVAEAYLVADGAIPFVTNWSQIPGWALLMAPFSKIYIWLNGSTEGMFLYMRLVSFILTVLFMSVIYRLLKGYLEPEYIRIIYIMPAVVPFFHGLTVFRADRPALFIIWISGILLVLSLYDNGKKHYAFFSGICAAAAILCYAQLLIYCFIIVLMLVGYELKQDKKFVITFRFVMGGILTAGVTTGYLIIKSGNIYRFIKGFQYLLSDVAYFRIENDGIYKFAPFMKVVLLDIIIKHILFYTGLAAVICAIITYKRRCYDKQYFRLLSLTYGTVLSCISYVIEYHNVRLLIIIYYICLHLYLTAPWFVLYTHKYKKLCSLLLFFFWFPSGVWMIVTALTTYAEPVTRTLLLSNGSFLTLLFAALAFRELMDKTDTVLTGIAASCILAAVVSFSMLFNVYSYMYRDGDIGQLNHRVRTGAYKGVFTTKERKQGIIKLEEVIREYTNEDNRVLAMESVPFVYLMTDAHPCTPSTWDQSMYVHGFNDDSLYMHYFEMTGSVPDRIIYIQSEIHADISIDCEGYRFNDYVDENYELIYEDRDAMYPVLIYARKNNN